MSDIVTEVAKYKQGWKGGLPETPCGSGSKLENTIKQREWIPEMIELYDIKTVSDIGAGDLNWIKHVDLGDVKYTPYDLVPRKPEVQSFDIVNQIPPKSDLIMCLWVLNHLPYDHAQKAMQNIIASGSKYLMMTDRPIWHHEQPPEITEAKAIEEISLNGKRDSIKLVKLCGDGKQ